MRRLYFNQGGFDTNMRAYYLQDSWSMMDDRLNLQLGIRNDRFRNYTQNGDKYYDSGDNWAPRLGLTFDVFGDKRTKFNAFYGKYYLPIATNTNIRLGGSELYYQQSMTPTRAALRMRTATASPTSSPSMRSATSTTSLPTRAV